MAQRGSPLGEVILGVIQGYYGEKSQREAEAREQARADKDMSEQRRIDAIKAMGSAKTLEQAMLILPLAQQYGYRPEGNVMPGLTPGAQTAAQSYTSGQPGAVPGTGMPGRTMTQFAPGQGPQMGGAAGNPRLGAAISAMLAQGRGAPTADYLKGTRPPGEAGLAQPGAPQTTEYAPTPQEMKQYGLGDVRRSEAHMDPVFRALHLKRLQADRGERREEEAQVRDRSDKYRLQAARIAATAGAPKEAMRWIMHGWDGTAMDAPDVTEHLTGMGMEIDAANKVALEIAKAKRRRGVGRLRRRPERASVSRVKQSVLNNDKAGFVKMVDSDMLPDLPAGSSIGAINASWDRRRKQLKVGKRDAVRLKSLKVKQQRLSRKIASKERQGLKPQLANRPDSPAYKKWETGLNTMRSNLAEIEVEMDALEGLADDGSVAGAGGGAGEGGLSPRFEALLQALLQLPPEEQLAEIEALFASGRLTDAEADALYEFHGEQ